MSVTVALLAAYSGGVVYASWTTQTLVQSALGTGNLGLEVDGISASFSFECGWAVEDEELDDHDGHRESSGDRNGDNGHHGDHEDEPDDVICDATATSGGFTVSNTGSIPSTPYLELSLSSQDLEDDCSLFAIALTIDSRADPFFQGPLCDLFGTQVRIVPQLDPGDSVEVEMEVTLVEPLSEGEDGLEIHLEPLAEVTFVQWNSGAPATPGFFGWSASQSWDVGFWLTLEPPADEPPDHGDCNDAESPEDGHCDDASSDDDDCDDHSSDDEKFSDGHSCEPSDDDESSAEEVSGDDNKSATDGPSAEEPPGEESPSNESPTNDSPAEVSPVVEPPATEPPAEVPSVEEPSSEDPPVDEPSMEELPSEEPPAEDLSLDPALASLAGHVWNDLDGDWVAVPGGAEQGIAMAVVILYDEGGDEVARVETDDDGNYLFTDIEPGDYVVEFMAPEGFGFEDPIEAIPDDLDTFLEQLVAELGVELDEIVIADVVEFELDTADHGWVGTTEFVSLASGDSVGLADAALVMLPDEGNEEAESTSDSDTDVVASTNPNATTTEPEAQPDLGDDTTVEPEGDASAQDPAPSASTDDGSIDDGSIDGSTTAAPDTAEPPPDTGGEAPPAGGSGGEGEQP